MVLTRAQAAAQASEHAQEAASDISSAIVELPSDNAVLVASAPALETVPGGVDYLAKIAEYFLAQTQALAAEHVVLLTQQQGQNNAHSAALTAAQATTESRVHREALTTTQAGLQEQFQSLRLMQDERGLQIERAVNDRLSHALKEMENELNESRLRIASQSDGVDHRFGTIEAKINGVLEAVMTRVNSLVEEKIDLLSKHQSSDDGTTHLVQRLVESSSVEVSANINQSLQIALQESHNEQKQEWMQAISTVEEHLRESVQCFVVEAASNIERQLESRVQKAITNAQSELNLQMQRQADATATLREQFRKQNAHAKEPPPTIDEDAIKATVKAKRQ
ncbi:hypothetical protein PHPALM_30139 [Phytophthora palmivora]|uniref:Uncharacterized protein n=1 Tax=Phytophthora palmivora TaxID=4796 RepID=A0A2P4X5U8_9STRA|nr:hypothetical protein PHPALM_30139 [Phytophthora palmivora]